MSKTFFFFSLSPHVQYTVSVLVSYMSLRHTIDRVLSTAFILQRSEFAEAVQCTLLDSFQVLVCDFPVSRKTPRSVTPPSPRHLCALSHSQFFQVCHDNEQPVWQKVHINAVDPSAQMSWKTTKKREREKKKKDTRIENKGLMMYDISEKGIKVFSFSFFPFPCLFFLINWLDGENVQFCQSDAAVIDEAGIVTRELEVDIFAAQAI